MLKCDELVYSDYIYNNNKINRSYRWQYHNEYYYISMSIVKGGKGVQLYPLALKKKIKKYRNYY